MEPQNVYDDAAFFQGYAELRRTEAGLNAVLEQPAMQRLLPLSVQGLSVLDLGCGFGDFSRMVRSRGARNVVGLDVSARMLAEAARRTDDPAVRYIRGPIEELDLEGEMFDLVNSSLALHYVADYADALSRIAALTTPGGHLVFSVEHPMWTSRPEQEWHRAADGTIMHWPVAQYGREGERRTRWFVDGVIKYHRTVSSYINGVTNSGFVIRQIDEPIPSAEEIAKRPSLEPCCHCPNFLLISATRA